MVSRQKLLHAAATVFAESGFRGATTRRIAEVAGVNEVTLFRLFGSKSQLMAEAVECLHPLQSMSLPDIPGDVERELVKWSASHLAGMRKIRRMMRKTMAELDEHPEMMPFVCESKTPYFTQLVTYVTKVCKPTTVAEREALRTACTMLSSALFSDAIGRDIVPSAYPAPGDSAARKYVRVFLRLLGTVPERHTARRIRNGRRPAR
ncbi:MAG: TetR/AcrR family transcriptional regulator [Gemmatimonadaceae bacterium]